MPLLHPRGISGVDLDTLLSFISMRCDATRLATYQYDAVHKVGKPAIGTSPYDAGPDRLIITSLMTKAYKKKGASQGTRFLARPLTGARGYPTHTHLQPRMRPGADHRESCHNLRQ